MRTAVTALATLFLALASSSARAGDTHNAFARFAEFLERVLASNPDTFQFTNLRNITVSPPVGAAGGASLVRSKNGLAARVMAADLTPGHAYTFWWIIFNHPEKCAQLPCQATDLINASGAIHYGSGAVASSDGAANVSFSTTSGGPPEGAIGNPSLPERGLMRDRGFAASIHLVIVDHGVPTVADLASGSPDAPGTWGWELTHPKPPGPAWVRVAVFEP
jgi:hypothetical protein